MTPVPSPDGCLTSNVRTLARTRPELSLDNTWFCTVLSFIVRVSSCSSEQPGSWQQSRYFRTRHLQRSSLEQWRCCPGLEQIDDVRRQSHFHSVIPFLWFLVFCIDVVNSVNPAVGFSVFS